MRNPYPAAEALPSVLQSPSYRRSYRLRPCSIILRIHARTTRTFFTVSPRDLAAENQDDERQIFSFLRAMPLQVLKARYHSWGKVKDLKYEPICGVRRAPHRSIARACHVIQICIEDRETRD
jgi:hypothetical protein